MAKGEDYLDGLLDSFMNDPSIKDKPERVFETEDNFLDEFDEDFLDEDLGEFLREFEDELDFDGDAGFKDAPDFGSLSEDFKNELDEVIVGAKDIVEGASENADSGKLKDYQKTASEIEKENAAIDAKEPGEEKETGPDEPADTAKDALKPADDGTLDETAEGGETFNEELDGTALYEEAQAAKAAAEEGEMDEADAALMELLKNSEGDSDLSEIGDLLKADEEGIPVGGQADEGENSEAVALSPEEADFKEYKEGENAEVASGEKEAPGGILGFLLKLVFGKNAREDDEEEKAASDGVEEKDKMSAENQAILEALDGEKQEELDPKEAKKKAKKEAAEAKKKAKKEAAEAKKKEKEAKKAAKPKKEKKPKPPKDPNKKPINKRPIIVVAVFTASVVIFVKLLSSAGSYSADLIKSHSYYKAGLYTEAYEKMAGAKIHKGDEDYYKKTRLLALMQDALQKYEVYESNEKYAEGIDVLIRALGKYELNYTLADELGVLTPYTDMENQIETALAKYGIDYDKAIELYEINKRDDYTVEILQIVRDMET